MVEEAEELRIAEEEKASAKQRALEAKQRERAEEEFKIKQSILEAGENKDIHKLNEAIEAAMQQGLNDDDQLEHANQLRNQLQTYNETKDRLLAACGIPKMENGISTSAVSNLDDAIAY